MMRHRAPGCAPLGEHVSRATGQTIAERSARSTRPRPRFSSGRRTNSLLEQLFRSRSRSSHCSTPPSPSLLNCLTNSPHTHVLSGCAPRQTKPLERGLADGDYRLVDRARSIGDVVVQTRAHSRRTFAIRASLHPRPAPSIERGRTSSRPSGQPPSAPPGAWATPSRVTLADHDHAQQVAFETATFGVLEQVQTAAAAYSCSANEPIARTGVMRSAR